MNSAIELIANVQSIRLELASLLPSVLRLLARSGNACTGLFVLMTEGLAFSGFDDVNRSCSAQQGFASWAPPGLNHSL